MIEIFYLIVLFYIVFICEYYSMCIISLLYIIILVVVYMGLSCSEDVWCYVEDIMWMINYCVYFC